MRINKKLVDKHTGYGGWFRKDYDSNNYYVDVDKSGYLLAQIVFVLVFLTAIVLTIGAVVNQHTTDVKKWNHICDLMAGKNAHYITGMPTNGVAESCRIAPDWKRTDI